MSKTTHPFLEDTPSQFMYAETVVVVSVSPPCFERVSTFVVSSFFKGETNKGTNPENK